MHDNGSARSAGGSRRTLRNRGSRVIPYLIVFGASAGAAFVATPLVRRFAVHSGAIDRPSDRKVHPKPTPTLGGLALYIGVVIGMGVSRLLPFFHRLDCRASRTVPIAAIASSAHPYVTPGTKIFWPAPRTALLPGIKGVIAIGRPRCTCNQSRIIMRDCSAILLGRLPAVAK